MRSTADTCAAILAQTIMPDLKQFDSIEDKLKFAFKEAQEFWMTTDPSPRYRGAVAAVIVEAKGHPDHDKLERSALFVSNMSKLLEGASIDPDVLEEQSVDVYPLIAWWNEARKAAKR